jgi:cytochrome b561
MNAIDRPIHGPLRYGSVTLAIHWATAVLVLVAFVYGPGGSELRVYEHARDAERQLHETLGLCVFALVVLRVLWRLVDVRPPPEAVSRWMGLAAKAVQAALYGLLFAVPLTAVAGAWLEGHPLTLLAGLEIPPLVASAHATGERVANLHTWLGDALLWLAGAHALAGLYHHFALRDGVLVSMLPHWLPVRQHRRD